MSLRDLNLASLDDQLEELELNLGAARAAVSYQAKEITTRCGVLSTLAGQLDNPNMKDVTRDEWNAQVFKVMCDKAAEINDHLNKLQVELNAGRLYAEFYDMLDPNWEDRKFYYDHGM